VGYGTSWARRHLSIKSGGEDLKERIADRSPIEARRRPYQEGGFGARDLEREKQKTGADHQCRKVCALSLGRLTQQGGSRDARGRSCEVNGKSGMGRCRMCVRRLSREKSIYVSGQEEDFEGGKNLAIGVSSRGRISGDRVVLIDRVLSARGGAGKLGATSHRGVVKEPV